MQTLATLAICAALSHIPATWGTALMYLNPPTPTPIYLYERAHDLLPAGEQWELNEALREAGDWDLYR